MVSPKKRINGQYWTDIENNLMTQYFSTGSTRLQKAQAINIVYPKLRMMGRIIAERYFNHYNDWDLIDDAISNFLLYCKFDSSKGSYYSYISNSLKNYIHSKVLPMHGFTKKISIDDNYDINDNEWLINDYFESPEFDEYDTNTRELKLTEIIAYLKQAEKKVLNTIKTYKKRPEFNHMLLKHAKYQRDYLRCVIEYFNTYFVSSSVSANALYDWLKVNCKTVPPYQHLKLSYKYLGIASTNKLDDLESQKENRWNKQGRTYFQDDYTPDNANARFRAGKRYVNKDKDSIEFDYF